MEFGAVLRSADDHAFGRANHQAAGLQIDLLFRRGAQLSPELVGALNDRDVDRVFEIGFADDPCLPVRRTLFVRRLEAVETEDLEAGTGEMICRGAAHGAEAHDYDIKLA